MFEQSPAGDEVEHKEHEVIQGVNGRDCGHAGEHDPVINSILEERKPLKRVDEQNNLYGK